MIAKKPSQICEVAINHGLWRILSLTLVSIILSCKTRSYSQSDLQGGRSFDEIQARMIGDLEQLSKPESPGGVFLDKQTVDSLIDQLDSSSPGMLKLTIDGQVLSLDGKPLGTKDANYTDFFTALDRAVASLSGGQKYSLQGSGGSGAALDILIKAQRKGDLDLQKSWLKRETSQQVKIKVIEMSLTSNADGLKLQGAGTGTEKEIIVDPGLDFTKHRKVYIVYALKSMLAPKLQYDLGPISPATQESGECRRRRTLSAPSIIPFKRGDLDRLCAANVRKYKDIGFRRIALFPVVHYAGGSYDMRASESENSTKETKLPGSPQIGKDFRFEILNAPSAQEVERCVSLILDAGMELSYVPHAESIVTMNAPGESEWRIKLGFPADNDEFYELAYGPLVRVLKQKGDRLKNPLMVSLAAEIDTVALVYPDTVIKLADRLRKDLKVEPSMLRLEWNPNGDFSHEMNLQKVYSERGINGCQNLKDLLLSKIDGIAPSSYDNYGHIAPIVQSIPTLVDTRDLFFNRLEKYLNTQCPGLGSPVKTHLRDRYGIAEFSLQGDRRNRYGEFLESALKTQKGQNHRINFWTTGETAFDPFAPGQDDSFGPPGKKWETPPVPGPLPEAQIRQFLECRS